MSEIKIGTHLWKWGFMTLLEYEITGIITRVDSVMLYEAKCVSCTHGWTCEVLLGRTGGNNTLQFVGVTNDADEEESQHYSHNLEGHYYFTERAAKMARLKQHVREKKQAIEETEKRLKREQKELSEYENALDLLKEKEEA